MTLDWNIEKVKDYKELYIKEGDLFRLNAVTENICSATQWVGISHITERNYEDFYFRLLMWDSIRGATISTKIDGKWKYTTPSLNDIKRHIGLWTNADSRTKIQQYQHLLKIVIRDAEPDKRRFY